MNKNKIAQLMMILIGWLVILVQANASLSIIPNKNCLSRTHLGDCIIQMTAGSNVPATVTIFNNSTRVTAANIRAILPSDWADVSQDVSNCVTLPPQHSCVLKFFPGSATHAPTSIPIVGTRTNTSYVTMEVVAATYTIGGSISGLTASGLILQNNGGDNLLVPAGATSFQFSTPVAAGGNYNVTIQQQPTGLTCIVDNSTGTNIMANVTNINIICNTTMYTIGGFVSGLTTEGLVLQNNGGDNLLVPAGATSFQFSTPVAAGGNYNVTLQQQPTGLTCTVDNGTGTNIMANVTNISITCNATTYTIGGSISGLTANGLILQNNGGDNLSVPAGATSFQFPTPVAAGGSYNVTIQQQPTGLTCTVDNATGTNVMANVTNISIICSVTTYTIGGSISGLTADGLVLLNNGGDNLSVPAGATSFQFPTPVAAGGDYNVTVQQQPSGLKCSVSQGSGSNVMADVTDISITCVVLYTYVSNSGANTVSLCNINQTTGELTCPGTTGSGFNNPRAIHINPTGTFAYIVNQNNGSITLCSVNQTSGVLTCMGSTGGSFQSPIDIGINPAGTRAYVTNGGNDTVSHCIVNQSTGELTSCHPTGEGFDGPGGITVNPTGTFAYIVNEFGDNISVCSINQNTGVFTSCSEYTGDFDHPNRITLNPLGNFAYVSNSLGNIATSKVTLCSVDQNTGGLTCLGTTGSGFNQPFGITINSANTFAYIANSGNSTVSLCNITQSTGALSCPGTTGSGFTNPTGIAITGNL
ncbi:transmembrane protein [Legionella gratiana]|uniref:Transmembrane protein n=1 Tax=Legionella gratiana TaxID=45066 RepID=A0A378J257_9GAMM|nr:beta-propeller fold lactonase family protein [Legionella gratiana]KTD11629.1 transmembrane protein [Legionella gratiana]STX41041.1 transmembrane protein [Legionella gratiana]